MLNWYKLIFVLCSHEEILTHCISTNYFKRQWKAKYQLFSCLFVDYKLLDRLLRLIRRSYDFLISFSFGIELNFMILLKSFFFKFLTISKNVFLLSMIPTINISWWEKSKLKSIIGKPFIFNFVEIEIGKHREIFIEMESNKIQSSILY